MGWLVWPEQVSCRAAPCCIPVLLSFYGWIPFLTPTTSQCMPGAFNMAPSPVISAFYVALTIYYYSGCEAFRIIGNFLIQTKGGVKMEDI